MAFTPMADRVLIDQAEQESTTSSGFIIPQAVQEVANRGTVIAVGPGRTTKDGTVIPVAVQVGDRVMFESGAQIPVKIDGVQLLILKEEHLIAVLPQEST